MGAFGVLAAVVIVVAVLAIVARDEARNARDQQDIARREANNAKVSDRNRQLQVARLYEEQGRQLVVEERYQEAIPYFLEARRNGDDSKPLRMMFRTAAKHLPLTSALAQRAAVVSAAFSPDGTRVVTASFDKTARVWDAATGKPLTSALEHQAEVVS